MHNTFHATSPYPILRGGIMKKLRIADEETMKVAIQQEIQRSEESRFDHRLHGVLLVAQGLDCYKVAGMFGQSPATVQRWVRRFNESGFAGLREGERPGRPRSLNKKMLTALRTDLKLSPRDVGYDQNIWDGKLLSHHIGVRFGVDLKVRQCQRLFSLLDFRLRKPRPVIAKADPERQAAYKKTPGTRAR